MNFNEIIINNTIVTVDNYEITILQLCEEYNISIPRFCYHRLLSISGNCRMCMVEVKNIPKPVLACSTTISKSMEIYTASDLVKIARENVLEFLLINHPLDCPICDRGGECDLQDQSMAFGSDRGRFYEIKRSVEDKNFGPVIKTIMSRCIHCTRCVRFAEEVASLPILGTMGRGEDTEIGTYVSMIIGHELSGNLVDICPVGALTSRPYAFKARSWELMEIDCIDVLDSLGSWIRIDVIGNEVMRVLPRRNDMINQEWISNQVRFFYEGVMLNRLLCFLCKSDFMHYNNEYYYYEYFMDSTANDEYLPCSVNHAVLVLYNSLIHNNITSIVVSDFLNMDELLYVCYFIKCIENDYSTLTSIMYNSDFRDQWLINTSLEKLAESNKILFMNNNLKQLCSVLNARIANHHYENQSEQVIYYIGKEKLNFFDLHLGISNLVWYSMVRNKCLCSSIFENEITFISNNETNVNTDILSYYNNVKHNVHYIALNCSTLNRLELSISTNLDNISQLDPSNNYFLYNIGEPTTESYLYSDKISKKNIIKTKNLEKDIVILSNSHYNNFVADLYLPTNTFHEVHGIYLNNLFKYSFSNKAVDLPGLSFSNVKLFKMLIMWLTINDNFIINNKIIFYTDNMSKINNYTHLIGMSNFNIYTRRTHKERLLSNMNIYEVDRKLVTHYNTLVCEAWGNSYHTIQNTYTKNSITLLSSNNSYYAGLYS